MIFDKSKVYTAVNADEVKVGSKGYFADDLYDLKYAVENDDTGKLHELTYIEDTTYTNRFRSNINHNLFYLVEEPAEKKSRPYKDTDEMIEDFKRRYNSYGGWSGKNNPMYCPLIWIKRNYGGDKHLVSCFGDNCVYISSSAFAMEELIGQFTYLDGTPCGILE